LFEVRRLHEFRYLKILGPCLLALSIIWVAPCAAARETDGRVTVLYVGDTGFETWRDIDGDPLLVTIPVPASVRHFSTDHIRRHMRQYIPRTYQRYSSDVDLLILSDTDRQLFTTQQQQWFRDGVSEAGGGMIMAGGLEAFGGGASGTSWDGSSVAEVLPVDILTGEVWNFAPFRARPAQGAVDHPFIKSLPWDSMPTFGGMNRVIARPWAELLLEAAGPGISASEPLPLLVYGEIGEGSSLAHAPDWTPGWGGRVMRQWEYYPDYVINMAYLASGIPVPQDLDLTHIVRSELASHRQRMGVTLSYLEFAEEFGANVHPLETRLSDVNELKQEADQLYIDQEYDAVLEKMREAGILLDELNQEAIELKDRALLWVYVVEWAAVTATMLLCGFVLWSLMVKRKLYREVKVTTYRG